MQVKKTQKFIVSFEHFYRQLYMGRYFKQYGAKRTGTNYLRALLEQNFADIVILMHTLGGKHGPPVDLQHYLAEFNDDPLGFTEAATAAIPAENSLPFNEGQGAFMKLHAKPLTEAVQKRQVHFLISIKDPYAWINSMFRQNYYRTFSGDNEMMDLLTRLIRKECHEYNTLYKSYWEFYQQFPQQTTIIPYEALIKDPDMLLLSLQDYLQLVPLSPDFSKILSISYPTDWDHFESSKQLGKGNFEKDYYLQQKYFGDMSTEMITIVEKEIDWNLAMLYGYRKR